MLCPCNLKAVKRSFPCCVLKCLLCSSELTITFYRTNSSNTFNVYPDQGMVSSAYCKHIQKCSRKYNSRLKFDIQIYFTDSWSPWIGVLTTVVLSDWKVRVILEGQVEFKNSLLLKSVQWNLFRGVFVLM